MPNRLLLVWGAFDALYFASSLVAIVFTVFWMRHVGTINVDSKVSTIRALLLDNTQLTAGLALGVVMAVSWTSSLLALIMGLRKGVAKLMPLKVFNWTLVVVMLATVVIGTSIWIVTLRERSAFGTIWKASSAETRQLIQNEFSCCGYWNASDTGLFGVREGFCANIDPNDPPQGCVSPLTNLADKIYSDIFTVVYAFGGVQMCLFLTTACLISVRHIEERYRKIAEKRGRGFV